jgi:two-component system, OmpR family, KDP operon response regulator KdpE
VPRGLKILLIEDEPAIVRALQPTLESTGASVRVAWSGSHGVEMLAHGEFDIVLCDLGLPDIHGLELIPQIRGISDVPVIVLSASGTEQARIQALDRGADDFINKPFQAGEFLARKRAVSRRRAPRTNGSSIKLDGLEVDLTRRRALLQGEEIKLSGREHALLSLLAEHAGKPVTHKQIIRAVWGEDAQVDTQFVRVLVGQLRQKIEAEPSAPELVRTEPGIGYTLAR